MTDRWPRYDVLTHRARTTPERTALIDADSGERWRYRALDGAVDSLAASLDDLGVSLGTRVGILLSTGPTYVRLLHAIWRLGGVAVPLNVQKTDAQLAAQAQRAAVDLLVCSGETAASATELGVDPAVSIDDAADVETATGVAPLPDAAAETLVPIARDVDSLALLLFTSGTTGQPKGVRLTRENLLASAEASAYRLGVKPGDRWLCCLPMYHMGGLAPAVRTALYGTTLVVQREFDASETAAVIDEYEISGVSLVPTMVKRMLDAGWTPPKNLDTVLLGGAPASESLLERALDREVPVYATYGTTETASQIATASPQQTADCPGTVGQPLVTTTIRILDGDEPADVGETGEIVVSGPTVTPGYLDEDRTTEAVDDYGFHTGDVGYRDADGRLWIVGRLDDRIVSGGENVDPEVVAGAIREHPAVDEVAVVGLPDEEWGERVAALVVGAVDTDEIREHCRERLAEFEVPKTVVVTDRIPRTPSGTVDREAVRERLRGAD
ncbi:o-succinylbenzoate--CoA ligase [Halapricum salinum]|uniref:O-succinylbenzoate--CoA ligase n=1 Tax=Halapricum salinum TaxID=1457250 RepID=A0A4D6H9N5_9EURY|nr:o-succinylbenzoate--CoA ligase [Halapricum salinum]QCC49858.1 o-succinylbenzoate--CoA ligase [Halapricum salinum]